MKFLNILIETSTTIEPVFGSQKTRALMRALGNCHRYSLTELLQMVDIEDIHKGIDSLVNIGAQNIIGDGTPLRNPGRGELPAGENIQRMLLAIDSSKEVPNQCLLL